MIWLSTSSRANLRALPSYMAVHDKLRSTSHGRSPASFPWPTCPSEGHDGCGQQAGSANPHPMAFRLAGGQEGYRAKSGQKRAKKGPQNGQKRAQKGPKMGQKWAKNGPKRAPFALSSEPEKGQKMALFGPLWRKVQGEWGGSAHSPDPTAQSAPPVRA